MSHTVVGVFSYTSEAQEAKEYLVNNGFNSADVDIATNGGLTDNDNNEDFGDRVGNFFGNLFGSDDDDARTKYTEAGRKGTIVTVHARSSDEAQRAAEILDNYGADDVDSGYGTTNTGVSDIDNTTLTTTDNLTSTDIPASATDYRATTGVTDYDSTETPAGSIPVISEDLQVGKREVESGGVRLKSRIVERPVEESIRLRQEHVNVERNTVNRPATEADFNSFKEGTIEVREHNEVPVVSKDARVVEEVSLDKEVSEREETIRDTVRNTEVDTETLTGNDTNTYNKTNTEGYIDRNDNV